MIAIDSANVHRILRGAVGYKRFRIIFEGPGGHSLHKFGIVGSAIHGLSALSSAWTNSRFRPIRSAPSTSA
ncbi:MAG: hypothetical protein ACLRRK_02585 [Parasutterella sp.]